MNIKKTICILALFLLLSCGYEPRYSKQNLENNYNFTIDKITFLGENKVNQTLKNNLLSFTNNKTKKIKYDLVINTNLIKEITSKNKKGNPETFSLKIITNVEISELNILKDSVSFEENFDYKNKSNKFELNQYERNIQGNLSSKISNNIIEHLYSLK
tara:strand:+ start:464 stop:937 length:474 start_codon:yes stop_codon:yes gene_type:complete